MATLRSGRRVDANANIKQDDKAPEKVIDDENSNDKPGKDKTTIVIFLGLLLDLLGKTVRGCSFFQYPLPVPPLPAKFDHAPLVYDQFSAIAAPHHD